MDKLNMTPVLDMVRDAKPLHQQLEVVLLSPVARLPPETLAYIFKLYVAGRDELTPDLFQPPQSPIPLSQVCRLWRSITETDPRLWTFIQFYFPETRESRERDVHRVQQAFNLYLERSSTLPISLTYTDHRTYSTSTRSLVSLLVDQLRKHSSRWKRISLHLSCGYFPLLFTFTPCNLSSLEHLHLSSVPGEPFVAPRLNLEPAMNLKSLSYSGSSRSLDGTADVNWEQLTEVSLDFSLHNRMPFLRSQQFAHLPQCRNITTCSLGIDQPSLNCDQTITLPHLRTLRVRRLSPHSNASFLDALVLPELQILEIDTSFLIDWYGSSPPWHDRNFSKLLARSRCALRHLSIQDVDFSSDEIVHCLALSPTLTSLCFIPYPRSQDIMDVVRALDVSYALPVMKDQMGHDQIIVGNGPLVPELREITLGTSREGCLDSMMAMLRSRGDACAQATALGRVKVVFFYMPHLPGDQLRRVADFRWELARWVSTENRIWKKRDRGRLEALVVIESPYLVEYINVE